MRTAFSRRSVLWMGSLALLAGGFAVWAILGAGALWAPPGPISAAAEWGRICWRLARQSVASAGSAAANLPPTIGLFLLASLVYGGVRGGMSYARTRRFLRGLPIRTSRVPTSVLRERPHGPGGKAGILIVEDDQPFAFTGGFLRPTIYLSRGMAQKFSGEEIRSVLRHEGEHVSRRDPLRGWMVDTLASALWFLPVAAHLRRRFLAAAEEEADDRAAGDEDGRLALASALVKAARGRAQGVYLAAPGFGAELSVTERIERLVNGPPGPGSKGWVPVLARSAGVVVLLAVLSMGGFGFAAGDGARPEMFSQVRGGMMRRGSGRPPMWMGGMGRRGHLRGERRPAMREMRERMERMRERGGKAPRFLRPGGLVPGVLPRTGGGFPMERSDMGSVR